MYFTKNDYQKIYELLNPSPLVDKDCGTLCENACCKSRGKDFGIYLLPGEELMFCEEDKDWLTWEEHNPLNYDFPPSWIQPVVYYANCIKPCPRNKRPIQCRTFPLAPHLINEENELILIWENLNTPYTCPLIAKKPSINPAYVQGLKKGWNILIKDPLIKDLVLYDSIQRKTKYVSYISS